MRKSEEHSTPAELGEGLFLGEELLSIVNVIRSPPRARGDDSWQVIFIMIKQHLI